MSVYTGGSFSGLNTVYTALTSMQGAFETVQQNIANANTPGYSRQTVVLSATSPYASISNAPDQAQQFGTGVQILAVQRNRASWLDEQARDTSSSLGASTQSANLLASAQNLFDDPGSISDTSAFNPQDFGMRKLMANYFNDWQNVGNQPENAAPRTVLLQDANEMASKIRDTYRGLEAVRNQADTLLADDAQKVNQYLDQIAQLNVKIKQEIGAGNNPNDLLDQRDQALTNVSQYIDVSHKIEPTGDMIVYTGGTVLVQDERVVNTLTTTPEPNNAGHLALQLTPRNDPADPPSPIVSKPFIPRSGEIAGIIHTRDVDIPGFENQLDTMAQQLVTQTNAIQTASFTANGTPGTAFFTASGPHFSQNIAVALTTPDQIATASTATGGPGDGTAAFNQGALATQALAGLNNQTLTGYYATLVGNVGTSVQIAQRSQQRYDGHLNQINAQQQSISGVNLDQEFIDLTKFQRAYEAASRAMSNYDDLLNQVINHMGRVGL